MLCGIYKLVFKGTSRVYIGQSTNINQRFNTHIYSMKHGTTSKKLLEAYNLYGFPDLEVLEECSKEELNSLETEIIDIYNSVEEGFNTLEEADSIPRSIGDLNGRSKFSNEKVEEVFKLLVANPNIIFTEVEAITGVPVTNIRKIATGENHTWLYSKYPEEYKILLNLVGTRKKHSRARGIPKGKLVSPTGNIYTVYNTKQFSEDNNLIPSCVGKLLSKKQLTHKGWRLCNEK